MTRLLTKPKDETKPIVRAYEFMRLIVGFLALLLPSALLMGDWVLNQNMWIRGSLSAYYHSGARDFFVATLVGCGSFMIVYRIFIADAESRLSTIAGISAIVVAVIPTSLPPGPGYVPTVLQVRFGEITAAWIHYSFAAILFLSLAIISWSWIRNGATWRRWKVYWRDGVHLACALLMSGAIAGLLVASWFDVFETYRLYVAEVVALCAFSVSWMVRINWSNLRGLTLDHVYGRTFKRFKHRPGVNDEEARALAVDSMMSQGYVSGEANLAAKHAKTHEPAVPAI